MNGLSSIDDHVSPMWLVPRLVTENVGTVGATLSGGSGTLTVLLLANLFPDASTACIENEYVVPAWRGGWAGYFHVTLVSVPGTLISRPQLSRTRYDALPVRGSQPNDTLHDVLPVERRFNAPGGGFFGDFASAGESGEASDVAGSVAS
jgi:hypothetical protein